jgi:hypothetical protein
MEPISLWLVLLSAWGLTPVWLLPPSPESWKAKSTREKLARAGTLAVIKSRLARRPRRSGAGGSADLRRRVQVTRGCSAPPPARGG